MKVHEIAAEGRSIAARMRRAHGAEIRDQNAVEFLSERAGEIEKLMNQLAASLDARQAEIRLGQQAWPKGRPGRILAEDGRVITVESLFRKASA